MATKIVTKNSSTASAVPTASDLVQGELAVNVADKRLFTEDNGGAIVELGTNPSTIDINAGTIDGTAIGASTASTGAFTTLTASGAFTSLGIDDNATSTAITIDASENVGIGTSSPSSTLHMYDSTTSITTNEVASGGVGVASMRLKHGTSHYGMYVGTTDNLIFYDYGNSAERMRIDSSGRVGIGTSSPSAQLHLAKAGGTLIKLGTSVNTSEIEAREVGGGQSLILSSVNSADHLVIDGAGNTTITAAGNPTLTVKGSDGAYSPFLVLHAAGGGGSVINAKGATSNSLSVQIADSEKMRIDSSGNVGIGVGNSKEAMIQSTNSGRVASNPAYSFNGDLDTGMFNPQTDNTVAFATGGSERLRIDSSGNLLVGCTTTAFHNSNSVAISVPQGYVLQNHVLGTGSGTKYTYFSYNAGEVGSITQNGTTGVNYNTSSDQRLKENIADADDAGSKIDSIQVRKYDWKADGSHQDYGMIAQELQTVAPEAVSGDADSEEMMGVDYSKLVPMLIKEIQSLRNRVAQLEE